MADVRVVDDTITKFFLKTCRVRPSSPSRHAVLAAVFGAQIIGTVSLKDNREAECFPLTTGSVAEFYIEPMLPCFGDIDIMFYTKGILAMPSGQQPPVNLPDEFSDYVKVVEIVDSHLPGYVYLKLQYFLTKCSDDGKYSAVKNDRQQFIVNFVHNDDKSEIHGPATLLTCKSMGSPLSVDCVPCVRCLSWPPQAADWPIRQRNYGWPDSATVDCVVSNGCDVVRVAHRQCRLDEWMSTRQCRLSFSRAEIVLTNSWLPVQQIVYHILRVFAKTERLTDSTDKSGPERLSNYHIKTLMLWACELKPRYWWTDDLGLVRICVQLLHILAVWVADVRCPHYFVMNCSLIDDSFDTETIASQLMSLDRTQLSAWFLNTYIRKCSRLYSNNISLLFDDAHTIKKLQTAVSVIINRRLDTAADDVTITFLVAEWHIVGNLHIMSNARSCAYAMNELTKLDKRLSFYFTSVAFIHIAQQISSNHCDDELMDVLATATGQHVGIQRYSKRTSIPVLREAYKLMSVVANKSLSTLEMIKIELSKAYLYRALRCTDAYSDSIYCLANVYLAVLCYTTGNYQTAIDHCTLVTRSQDLLQWQCSSHVVQGKLLPKIDDNIDSVLGLSVFYQYLRTVALNPQQKQHVGFFTTGLFAHYMQIKCLSAKECRNYVQMSFADEILRYSKSVMDTQQLAICDVLIVEIQFLHKGEDNRCQKSATGQTVPNTSDLVELLQRSAVEHLTAYRQLQIRDFGSVVTIIPTDFQALYAYKRGDYQSVYSCLRRTFTHCFSAVRGCDILVFPGFITLLDDDIVSLISLILIANPEGSYSVSFFCISQLTLLLYLMTQCQLKLRHSVTSLSQTLIYANVARRKHPSEWMHDQLTLKLIERKVLQYFES